MKWTNRSRGNRKELCQLENISLSTLIEIENSGFGPRWTRLPGTTADRLSPQARIEWHQRLAAWNAANADRLEAERKARIARMTLLGRQSIKSPKHPANRKRKTKRVRR